MPWCFPLCRKPHHLLSGLRLSAYMSRFLHATSSETFTRSFGTDRLVNLYPKHCNLQRIETTNSISFSKQYESRWLHFDSVTVMNLTGWAGGDTSYYTVSTQFKSNSLFISTSKNKRVMHCVIKSTTTLYLL